MKFVIPIKIVSTANLREHWAAKAKRAKHHRYVASVFMLAHKSEVDYVATITLTRIAPRPLDSDNLANGFKACRDGIADALGIDDGDTRIEWRYVQRKGKPKEYAVIVEIV